MNELLVIYADGNTAHIPNEYEAIRAMIGNWIDLARGHGPVSAFVDDEGMLNGCPLNVIASLFLGRPVYGPAVLVASAPGDDGETLTISPHEMDMIEAFGSMWGTVLAEASRLGQNLTVLPTPDTLPPPEVITMTDAQMKAWLFTGEEPLDG